MIRHAIATPLRWTARALRWTAQRIDPQTQTTVITIPPVTFNGLRIPLVENTNSTYPVITYRPSA